jgi:hypothetical protein
MFYVQTSCKVEILNAYKEMESQILGGYSTRVVNVGGQLNLVKITFNGGILCCHL